MTNALILICAYLLGSIPSALWVGQLFFKMDIRQFGSGNLGTTNTFRVLGKKAGIAVLFMDILKGTAAVLLVHLPFFADASIHILILGAVAVIGHIYPIFAKFKGGKAVATSAGVMLGYSWPFFVVLIAAFLISLKLTKMVSLTSMIASTIGLIYSIINWFLTGDIALVVITFILVAFIFYRHRENIQRIKDGTEPKIKGF
ncbi:MAG: glycerol-3-phosphate 1-O-acyltransferase PlsY [Solibacillus sp.]